MPFAASDVAAFVSRPTQRSYFRRVSTGKILRGAKVATKNQHVVPKDGGWAVRGEGNSRFTSSHATQKAAIGAARDRARKQGAELIVHGRDGKIRQRNMYGKDPLPPNG